MRRHSASIGASIGASLGVMMVGAHAALAGPLDWHIVPADAEWVIHVDVERIARSPILDALAHASNLEVHLDEMKQLGMDAQKDVHSITAYGWGKVEDEKFVVVIDGSGSIADAIVKLAEHEGDLDTTVENGRTYYDARDNGEDHVFAVIGDADVRVVMASTRAAVDQAADHRASERAPVIGDGPSDGSFIFMSAVDLKALVPHKGSDPHARLVQQAEKFRFEVSEQGDNIAARVGVSIIDSERTQDVVDLMQGLLAFGRMALRDNEETRPLADLASHVQITSRNSFVQITFDAPADQIAKLLQAHHRHEGNHEDRD